MDPARWERLQHLFHEAADLPLDERETFLRDACTDDPDLAASVLRLLEEDARPTSMLDRGMADVAQQVFDEPPPVPVSHIGRYAIRRSLGEGGMGVVYLAEREDLGSLVAIKVLRDAWVSPARRERFRLEQRTLARLNHPSIARLYDADTLSDGTPWFAMEYVEGLPLTAYCEERRWSLRDRLLLFRQVCEAVQHAHRQLVVHRDLKPSNVLVTAGGTVKLLDFGIAKQLEAGGEPADRTRTLFRMMTPAYAAPEQIRGEPAVVQTDVYALGVMLYELLAGRRPFDLSDRTPAEAEAIVLDQTPERPSVAARASGLGSSVGHAAWTDLDVMCLTAMHKDVDRRYASVETLIRDVDRYLAGEPLEARGDSVRYRTRKFLTRNRRPLAASALIGAVLMGLAAFYTVRLTAARNEALAEAARTRRIQRFMLDLFTGEQHGTAPARDLRVVTLVERGVRQARGLDADPAIQAELYHTLGSIYQQLGRHEEAGGLLQAALDRREALFGPTHPDVADTRVALGLLRLEEAKLDDAEQLVRSGLAAAERTLAAGHPVHAGATAALGRVHRERGDYDRAVALLEEAVAYYSRSPESAADLAAATTALANTHYYAGRFDVSEELNLKVLQMDRQMYGEKHPHVADDLINLGAIRAARGDHAGAERYYRTALEIVDAWYGEGHPETASARTILAQPILQQGNFDEAAALLRQALATQEAVYGSEHPRVALILNELGLIALRSDRLDEAEAALARTLEIYRRVYEGRHSRVGIAMANLASVYLAKKDLPRAEGLFRQAIDLYGKLLPPGHLNIGIARSKLGRVLLRQGRPADAETELLAALEILRQQGSPSSAWLRTTREDLVEVYEALEDSEKAAKYRRELASPPA